MMTINTSGVYTPGGGDPSPFAYYYLVTVNAVGGPGTVCAPDLSVGSITIGSAAATDGGTPMVGIGKEVEIVVELKGSGLSVSDTRSVNLLVQIGAKQVQQVVSLSEVAAANGKISVPFRVTFGSEDVGDKEILVEADPSNSIVESDELNNKGTQRIKVVGLCNVSDKGRVVPFYAQGDQEWGADFLAEDRDAGHTLANFGCTLTSLAMIFESYGISHVPNAPFTRGNFTTSSIDPGTLNVALAQYSRSPSYPTGVGFSPERNIIFAGAAAVARVGYFRRCVELTGEPNKCSEEAPAKVSFKGDFRGWDESKRKAVEDEICSGNPVMLELGKINGMSHFVVATGMDLDGQGDKTFIVNNPGKQNGENQRLTELTRLYPSIKGYRLYRPSDDPSMLMIHTSMNTHFIVSDPLGRRTGYDPLLAKTYSEIPGAVYDIESVSTPAETNVDQDLEIAERIFSMTAGVLDGSYQIEIFGINAGPFTLSMSSFDKNGFPNDRMIRSGTLERGQTETLEFTHDSLPAPVINASLELRRLKLLRHGPGGAFTDVYVTGRLTADGRSNLTLTRTLKISIGGKSGYNVEFAANDFEKRVKGRQMLYLLKSRKGIRLNISSDGEFSGEFKGLKSSAIPSGQTMLIQMAVDEVIGEEAGETRCHGRICDAREHRSHKERERFK